MSLNPLIEPLDGPKLANLRGIIDRGGNVLIIKKCLAGPTYFDRELNMKKLTIAAVLEKQLAKYGITMSYYFDRLSIYLDTDAREENVAVLPER